MGAAAEPGPGAPEEVIAGNVDDKYGSANPISRFMVGNFIKSLLVLAGQTGAREIHEVGCGEGHLSRILAGRGYRVRGSDISCQITEEAQREADRQAVEIPFKAASIYDLAPNQDAAPLVVCCEVLEHLPDPERAVEILAGLAKPHLIASVPREPLWRVLNMCRGKYLAHWGNTPGHLNHWSRGSFLRLLAARFEILQVKTPVPWVMALLRVK